MKQKRIRKLIEESGVLGFEFDNDDIMINWLVTPAEGRMIAMRIIEFEDGEYWEDFADVSYDNLEACDELYEDMVSDFVDCYGDSLRYGDAGELGLFSDIASKGDVGLIELLSFFGKTYDEFLLDVFYHYGFWLELEMMEEDFADDYEEPCYDEKAVADDRLVKAVLRHLCSTSLYIEAAENAGVYWEFAVARGEVWFHREDVGFVDECMYMKHEFGHVPLDDLDAFCALRDAVRACFETRSWAYEEEGDPFGILGLKLEDLVE